MWGESAARAFSHAAVAATLLILTTLGVLPTVQASLAKWREVPKPATLVVRDIDPGGMIGTYDMWWHRVADSGVLVIVDGDCVSACALMLGIVPPSHVCLTERATFGLHMATMPNEETGKREPDAGVTEWMIRRYYPPVVIKWIAAQGGLKPDVIYMHPSDFEGFYRQCSKEEYNPWPTEVATT